jgi:mycothiol system anti-sigma-R factor
VSCGRPHETDCREVLEDLYVYLDDECDQHAKSKIKRHLDECGPCLEEFGIEHEIKVLVARSCGGEHAPETLRAKLRATLRQAGVDSVGPGGASVEG